MRVSHHMHVACTRRVHIGPGAAVAMSCPGPRAMAVAVAQSGPALSHMFPQETWYWDASNVTEMVLSGVKCAGHEMSLSHCRHHSGHVNCKNTGTRFAAGVICSESECGTGALGGGS